MSIHQSISSSSINKHSSASSTSSTSSNQLQLQQLSNHMHSISLNHPSLSLAALTPEGTPPKAFSSNSTTSILHPPPNRTISPPTPAPSPQPQTDKDWSHLATHPQRIPSLRLDDSLTLIEAFSSLSLGSRTKFLNSLLPILNLNELTTLSGKILPRLKRDFLRELPIEISLHILSFVDDPKTLMRAGMVSRFWRSLVSDEATWKGMCWRRGFNNRNAPITSRPYPPDLPHHQFDDASNSTPSSTHPDQLNSLANTPTTANALEMHPPNSASSSMVEETEYSPRPPFSYKSYFKRAYLTESNWLRGPGDLITMQTSQNYDGNEWVVTSLCFDDDWIVVGMATSKIHVFDARTGEFVRMLAGHELGVWSLAGWGQKRSLVVSGGCDRDVRVWEVETGRCLHVLAGHSSTIRCMKVLEGRPIAISGSRDSTLRVWDIEQGVQKHLLVGHTLSVRAVEVHGNRAVSGSYDNTCRLWDVDTGECLKLLRGHYHQIYAVAFDGTRIASGSMDSTVCIWSAETGELLALLQGHTALVGQVQINGPSNVLVTGGSDGRVVVFSLESFECLHRLCAHDNSVTCLQFDDRFVVTGGNDGRVKLWDFKTGSFIRELAEPCEAVWRIVLRDDKAVLLCKRDGRTVMEVISFRPSLDSI
ncbi:uncharacterized protein MELLADRAFT_50952 [Melampsora larici-populina 98AG31]|uniref:F-box domain-containing protein n=1 Tax=Melampsora larici-populina (strain 98AG31 / pathotype 3-4-7) TaxID=747676 RepID=F4S9N2_MELLP|nr:uncharacterized protein MELLADRAFT_50952 [Melampsora larici-populina 98AG31]EGF98671.1 hypothetical protein MELLADRAFT_50952 [Melampsora larici-populina 98AG31]